MKTKIISRNFTINGVSQWLYINQCSRPKGTLLFIHGGPGWSDAPWAGMICQRLWGEVNTVHWDQRQCNRSSTEMKDQAPLTILQMMNDGLEVCRVLQEEFQVHRPILIGHSWGAFLSALMVSHASELFHSYIGIGQLVENRESEPLSLDFCKRRAQEEGREDLLIELNSMPNTFFRSVPTLFRQREIVSELGGELISPANQNQWEQWMLQSPLDYQSDWEKLNRSCENACSQLWPELIERSLLDEVQRIHVPITLLQGQMDYFTAVAPISKWLRNLSCSGQKELIIFDRSAHWPQIEENEKFARIILQTLTQN